MPADHSTAEGGNAMTEAPACWSWPLPHPDADPMAEFRDLPPDVYQDVLRGFEATGGVGEALLSMWQDGRCAICGRTEGPALVLDHDHQTGLARGWLCRSCNTREGQDGEAASVFGQYRERPPVAILGVGFRYLDPLTGRQPRTYPPAGDGWEDNPLIGTGL